VLAAATLMYAAALDIEEEQDVLVLTDDNFDEAIATYDPLLVEFYAPWCGHCKALKEPFAKAAGQLKEKGFRIAKLDATAHREAAGKYDIKGFPTLKWFRGGEASEYGGGRTAETIVNWVLKRAGPVATELADETAAAEFAAGKDAAVVGYFTAADSAAAKAFQNVAGDNDDLTFGVVYGANTDKLVMYRSFDGGEPVELTTGLGNQAAVKTWVARESLPLVVPFTGETSNRIFGGDMNIHFLSFMDREDAAHAEAFEGFSAAAADFKNDVLFITVGSEESRVRDYFELTEEDCPTAVLVDMSAGDMKKYFLTKGSNGEHDWSKAGVSQFVADFQAGQLTPSLKSEPVPAAGDDKDGDVQIVVGKSFEAIALDESKDVLLAFVAPWCGHCKALKPEFRKAASRVASATQDVVLATMDATANEINFEGATVRGFPTLYLFPAGSPKAVAFDGGREADGIVQWLSKNAVNKFDAAAVAEDAEAEEEEEL